MLKTRNERKYSISELVI